MARLIIVDAVTRFSTVAKAVEHFNPLVAYQRPEMRYISYPPPDSLKDALKEVDRRFRRDGPIEAEPDAYRDQMVDWADEEVEGLHGVQLWGLYGVEYETKNVVIDPMEAQVRWLADTDDVRRHIDQHSVQVLDDQRRVRFWDRRAEIEGWVAANAQRDVLAQPTTNGWRFVFLTYGDHLAFRDWIAQPKKTRITLKLRGMREDNIRSWIKENVRGEWYEIDPSKGKHLMRAEMTLMFRDTTDAAMCKMRWSDPNEGVEPEEV